MKLLLCDLVKIQTWNLLSRNQVLYSVELRSRIGMQRYLNFDFMQILLAKNFIIFFTPPRLSLRIIKIKKGVNPPGFPIFARIQCLLSKQIWWKKYTPSC